jgi:hypothetical protein
MYNSYTIESSSYLQINKRRHHHLILEFVYTRTRREGEEMKIASQQDEKSR